MFFTDYEYSGPNLSEPVNILLQVFKYLDFRVTVYWVFFFLLMVITLEMLKLNLCSFRVFFFPRQEQGVNGA